MTEIPIPKPTRISDYASRYGGYYWFEEMIYMDSRSEFHKIGLDTHNILIRDPHVHKCGRCQHCIEDKICERDYFADHIQEAYSKWWYEVFESKFLGIEEKK